MTEIGIIAVGGYNEMSRNMTGVRIDNDIIVLDMGLHLDHIGAIPKLAHRYKAPIIATPYTAELVKHEISDEKKFKVNNEVIRLKIGGIYNLTPDIQIEAGIEMLFPHRSVYFGKDIKPLNHK